MINKLKAGNISPVQEISEFLYFQSMIVDKPAATDMFIYQCALIFIRVKPVSVSFKHLQNYNFACNWYCHPQIFSLPILEVKAAQM